MTMNRIQTDREMKSVVTVIILALGVAFSMLFCYMKHLPLKGFLLCVNAICTPVLFFAVSMWAVRNQIDLSLIHI